MMGIRLCACQGSRGAQGEAEPAEPPPGSFPRPPCCPLCVGPQHLFKQTSKLFARKYLRTLESIRKTEQVRELAGVPGEQQELGHLVHPAVNTAQAPSLRKYPSCRCLVRRGQKSCFSPPGGCGLAQGKTSWSVEIAAQEGASEAKQVFKHKDQAGMTGIAGG